MPSCKNLIAGSVLALLASAVQAQVVGTGSTLKRSLMNEWATQFGPASGA